MTSEAGLVYQMKVEERGMLADLSSHVPTIAKLRLLTTIWLGGFAMWLVSYGAWRAYEPLMARFWPEIEPPRKRQPGEPRSWGGAFDRR